MHCRRYQNEIVLDDSTIGYHLARMYSFGFAKPFCGLLSYSSGFEVDLIPCDSKKTTAYVCEFELPGNETSPTDRTLQAVSSSQPKQWHWNSSQTSHLDLITCPQGQVTYAFLACDIISKCWHEDSSGSFSSARGVCSATLTPLPPSFACKGRGGHVPYTLVCDHRPDCFDGSDEDFCVFHSGQSTSTNDFVCLGDTAIQCGRTHEVWDSSRLNIPD